MSQSLFDEITHFAAAADPTGAPRPGQPVHPDDIVTALDRIGQRKAAGELIAADAMRDLRTWLPVALDAGIGKKEAARIVGVSRTTIHTLTREREGRG